MPSGKYTRKPCPEEVKRKISNTLRGRVFTEEWHRKQSEAHKGKKLPEETKKKLSDALKGRDFPHKYLPRSEETKKKISIAFTGERHPNWQGGKSYEPYCKKFKTPFKERVRIFFGRVCVGCGKKESDSNRRLDIHHVNYDKKVCCNENERLFVALCPSCHGKTQFNKEMWKKHYTKIINDKYNGKCYYTQEEYDRLPDISFT
jgi:hypothetical protein